MIYLYLFFKILLKTVKNERFETNKIDGFDCKQGFGYRIVTSE